MANYTSNKEKEKKLSKQWALETIIIGVLLGILTAFWLVKELSNNESEQQTASEQIVDYIGTIGKYKIDMTLNYTQKTGEYYYESQGAENKLYLTILTDTLNQLIIEEKDESDKVTGNFKGEFQNDSIYTGIFTNSKGKKFDFKLTPQ